MEWVTQLNKTDDETGRMLRLQYLKRVGDSKAESAHRVTLGDAQRPKVLYRGWSHDAFLFYDER